MLGMVKDPIRHQRRSGQANVASRCRHLLLLLLSRPLEKSGWRPEEDVEAVLAPLRRADCPVLIIAVEMSIEANGRR